MKKGSGAVASKIEEITNDKDIKAPLHTLFIALKHRKQWFDRKHQSDNIIQITKFLSEFKPEQMVLDGPNEAYLAYIYESCKDELNQIRVAMPSSSSTSILETPNLFSVRYVPINVRWRDFKSVLTVLKYIGLGTLVLVLYYLALRYNKQTRRNLQKHRFSSSYKPRDNMPYMRWLN
ncbi:hypothetical protein AKO1_013002 [Acrasis kona]|uniref:Uncharacterized protein n=1 Tax=Acrasis kona TaxID=1008807 RepID=A0AAW2YZ20_9EUKA